MQPSYIIIRSHRIIIDIHRCMSKPGKFESILLCELRKYNYRMTEIAVASKRSAAYAQEQGTRGGCCPLEYIGGGRRIVLPSGHHIFKIK